jgi:hypothetical protein
MPHKTIFMLGEIRVGKVYILKISRDVVFETKKKFYIDTASFDLIDRDLINCMGRGRQFTSIPHPDAISALSSSEGELGVKWAQV